jgi:hypothetical protein
VRQPRCGVGCVDEDPAPWRFVAVYVVRERAAARLDEAVAGIARGVEILEVVPLDPERSALTRGLRDRGAAGYPVDGGAPSAVIVAADVPPPAGVPVDDDRVEARFEQVRFHTVRRVLHGVASRDAFEPVWRVRDVEEALDDVEAVTGPGLRTRLRHRLRALTEACAVPYPVARMLGTDCAGFRARVALVEHPVHGACVCKVFRPGAEVYFRRELQARLELADLPLVPALLEHGDNWLLTPLYRDDERHVLRELPLLPDMAQLRLDAARAVAEFARHLHERGKFVLDLSPQNLMSDPVAGLKVLDLEFVVDYPGPTPALEACYSFRGAPREVHEAIDLVRNVPLTRGVGNSVFHPAVAGLPVASLLRPARRGDGVRARLTQWGWYAALRLAERPIALLRARRRGR